MGKPFTIRVYAVKNGERKEISDPFDLKCMYEELQDADRVHIEVSPPTKNTGTSPQYAINPSKGISLQLDPRVLWAALILLDSWSEDVDFIKAAQSIE